MENTRVLVETHNETAQLQTFLLQDDTSRLTYLNNNFDSWRDDILEMEVTLLMTMESRFNRHFRFDILHLITT